MVDEPAGASCSPRVSMEPRRAHARGGREPCSPAGSKAATAGRRGATAAAGASRKVGCSGCHDGVDRAGMATATFTSMMLLISGVAGAFVLGDRQWLSLQRPSATPQSATSGPSPAGSPRTGLINNWRRWFLYPMHPHRLHSARWSERLTGVSGAWRSRDRRSNGRGVARVTAHRSVRLGRDAVLARESA